MEQKNGFEAFRGPTKNVLVKDDIVFHQESEFLARIPRFFPMYAHAAHVHFKNAVYIYQYVHLRWYVLDF